MAFYDRRRGLVGGGADHAERARFADPLRRDFWPIASLSIFGMTAGQFLFHWALDYASVVEVATLVTTMPILVVFVAKLVDGTAIGPAKLISGTGAFLGCVFLLSDGFAAEVSGAATI